MSLLLALDPSIRSSGLAVFYGGELVHAGTIKVGVRGGDPADAAYYMAGKIVATFDEWCAAEAALQVESFVFEWPQVYRASKSKGDPNDLPALAAIGCAVAAMLACPAVTSYTPAEWAGQIPKATKSKSAADNSPRATRIRSRLSEAELRHWPAGQHDAIDAVGLGLHFLDRLAPKRLFPGATP